ncbi:MAG: DUF898 family protein [Tidjanibacter sp.]|nr:DUF898 family protein [Tidjanibacter sp.]
MRNYFSFNLKTKAVLWPMLIVWLVFVLYSLGEYLLFGANKIFSLTTPVNLDLVLNVLLCGLLIFVALVVVCSALYFVVEKSVAAVVYKESVFDTDFRFGEFFKQILPDVLFSVLTLGLYAPWFLTRLVRYFSRRIVHGGNVLEFEGKPMMLFNISVLLYVLPMVAYEIAMKEVTERFAEDQSMLLFWSVLLLGLFFVAISLYTTGVYSKWLLKGWYGNRRLVSTASMWDGGWFVFGQLFLSLITIGLYAPAASLKIWRYFTQSLVVGTDKIEGRFGMELHMWRDWLYFLGQMLLLIITLGLYLPWYYKKVYGRFFARIYVESENKPTEPMPDFE